MIPESSDECAERLAAAAVELVTRVRDYAPDDNWVWLQHQLPDPSDRQRLAFVLAAAVPDNVSWRQLTAWIADPRGENWRRPCGTPAAYRRHIAHGETPCVACCEAERAYSRLRKRKQRRAAAA